MAQIAVRLSELELARLDSLIDQGVFRTRAEGVRAGLAMLSERAREDRISASYASAYARQPLTDDEREMLDAATALASQLPA